MYERTLVRTILDLVEAESRARSLSRVRRVRVVLGALAVVEPAALYDGFERAARGTIAEGAALELERQPGEGECVNCGARSVVARRGDACPRCGSHLVLLRGGEELRVAGLEVV